MAEHGSPIVVIPGKKTDKVDPPPGEPKLVPSSPNIHRPPCAPPDVFGPFINFLTTTRDHKWTGSVLVMHRGGERPKLEFPSYEVSQACEVLYADVWGMTALRFNIEMAIPDGVGDQEVAWTLSADDKGYKESGKFFIAKWDQKWRGCFHSCDGFDETVPLDTIKNLGFDGVWRHLNSVHESTPCHVVIWGGDQVYMDQIFHDIPFLTRWIDMDWDLKWSHEFSEKTAREASQYYFNTYGETWARPEVKAASGSIPSLMQWDDHDIFDGAKTYPPELRNSPVMSGLFETAQIYRLLFQHHTTPALARSHGLFGHLGHNWIAQMGPQLACFGNDGRTERDEDTVTDKESWDMIHKRLRGDGIQEGTKHLLVVFAVPFSFLRFRVVESVLGIIKNHAWLRNMPGLKSQNSIFSIPEFYDDLGDEWCAERHIKERDTQLKFFQELAAERSLRITYLSGDVHCAALSRFRSDKAAQRAENLTPETDPRLSYQIISSAIVNQAPSPTACVMYHYLQTKWHPIAKTEEGLLDIFERRPESGKHTRHRKVAPNRNYTYFEAVGAEGSLGSSTVPSQTFNDGSKLKPNVAKHHHLSFSRSHYGFEKGHAYPSTLGPTSSQDGRGFSGPPLHHHRHGPFCHHKKGQPIARSEEKPEDIGESTNAEREKDSTQIGLRLRIWLESRDLEEAGRQFSSYDVIVPDLVIQKTSKLSNGVNGHTSA